MIKIKELRAYQQVKHVLGAKEAERQLFIALNSKDTLATYASVGEVTLHTMDVWNLFLWRSSPQGYEYWADIADTYNPEWDRAINL